MKPIGLSTSIVKPRSSNGLSPRQNVSRTFQVHEHVLTVGDVAHHNRAELHQERCYFPRLCGFIQMARFDTEFPNLQLKFMAYLFT